MPTARLWRIRASRTVQMVHFAVAEVAFLSDAGVDLSIGGVAIASTEYNSGFGAAMAFDKNTSSASRWASMATAVPAWIGYNHPSPVAPASIRIHCDNDPGNGVNTSPPSDDFLFVDYSLDGIRWRQIAWYRKSGDWVNGGIVEITLDHSVVQAVAPSPGIALHGTAAVEASVSVIQSMAVRELEFGGAGEFPFLVEGLTGSQKARVTLQRARDKLVARETWSAANGTGVFTGLDVNTKFIALAEAPDGTMHPVAAAHFPRVVVSGV